MSQYPLEHSPYDVETHTLPRPDDIWRVEAQFSHLDKPVSYATNTGKRAAYECVARWLMSENIQRIEVRHNGECCQFIVVEDVRSHS